MPGSGAGVSDVRVAETDPRSAAACGWVAGGISKKGAKETLLARSCIGYIKAQQSSDGQASSTVENSSMKAWCFPSSSAIASWFNVATLSKSACCRTVAVATCHALASVCHASASVSCASALASQVSFWHADNSALKPCFLWWQSSDAVTTGNSIRAVVTFLCSRSSLDRLAGSLSEMARGHLTRELLSASGVLDLVGWIYCAEPGEWLDRDAGDVQALCVGELPLGWG